MACAMSTTATTKSYAESLSAPSAAQCANRGALVASASTMAGGAAGSSTHRRPARARGACPFSHNGVDLREAEEFAVSIKDRLRTGQLTPEEKARCIEIALMLAEPQRVAAVHRAVRHAEAHARPGETMEIFKDNAASTESDNELLPPSHLPNSRLRVYRSRVVKHVAKRSSGLGRAPLGTINEMMNLE